MNVAKKVYKLPPLYLQHGGRLASTKVCSEQKAKKNVLKSALNPSSLYKDMQQHASKVAPEDFKYLSETYIKRLHQVKTKGDHDILREGKMSLWDYLMTYQQHYDEKAVLIDAHIAAKIAKAIVNNSDAQCNQDLKQSTDRQTIFIDANGGLCRVTNEIINESNKAGHIFSCYKIFEKDVNLVVALQRARNDYLKSNVPDNPGNVMSLMNVNQHVTHYLSCKLKDEYISELYQRVLVRYPSIPWKDKVPIYTLYLTAPLASIRHFVMQSLYRNESCSNDISRGRPEFFFIISPKTWAHLSLGTCYEQSPNKHLTTAKNILFNLLFEYTLLEPIPRKSLVPWAKKPKDKQSKRKQLKITQTINQDGNMYLIKTRPKPDIGIINYHNFGDTSPNEDVQHPPAHWLEYFVHAITVESANNRFLPLLDKWHPSAALYCVRKGIVPIYMTLEDFFVSTKVEEKIIPIFNSLLAQKNLPISSFVAMADTYKKGELKRESSGAYAYSDESSVEFSIPFRSFHHPDENFEEPSED